MATFRLEAAARRPEISRLIPRTPVDSPVDGTVAAIAPRENKKMGESVWARANARAKKNDAESRGRVSEEICEYGASEELRGKRGSISDWLAGSLLINDE